VITSAELYAMAMESPTAYLRMPELCEALGIAFPPTQSKGLQPPVSAEFLGATSWDLLHQTTDGHLKACPIGQTGTNVKHGCA
jgi:hypothetical protein